MAKASAVLAFAFRMLRERSYFVKDDVSIIEWQAQDQDERGDSRDFCFFLSSGYSLMMDHRSVVLLLKLWENSFPKEGDLKSGAASSFEA